jgi:hypothetical protein
LGKESKNVAGSAKQPPIGLELKTNGEISRKTLFFSLVHPLRRGDS